MPYIPQAWREEFEPAIRELIALNPDVGEMNYTISRLLFLWSIPSYEAYNAVIGVLECVKQEFYRRVVAPYENGKLDENGEVFN